METTGRMLVGSEIGAALTALEAMRPDVIGLNCATGPDEMTEHLRYLAQHAAHVPLVPPERGPAVGRRRPHALRPHARGARRRARALRRRVRRQHRRRLLRHHARAPARGRRAPRRPARRWPATPELRAGLLVDLQPGPVPPGARVPRHRRAHERQRLEEVPRRDARGRLGHLRADGARAGEGRRARPRRVRRLRRAATAPSTWTRSRAASRTQAALPLVFDSTEPRGARGRPPALGRQGDPQLGQPRGRRGRGLALRPGDVAGARVRRRGDLPRDRRGGPGPRPPTGSCASASASTTSRSSATASTRPTSSSTCSRSRSAPGRRTSAATASRPSRRSGASKAELPGSSTILGLSNVSFGLKPAIRHVLNSVFLHECREAGLDAAIVHAARIMPMHKIDDHVREVALDLVYDRRRDGYDPLTELMALLRGRRGRRGRAGGPLGLAGRASGSSTASSTATATASRPTSTKQLAARPALVDRQRRAARGHEGRRRPLRPRARCSCRSCSRARRR